MKRGTLYGIGVGPGDPELLTVKGMKILSECRFVFAPKGDEVSESSALGIARSYLHPLAKVNQLVFSMTRDPEKLSLSWEKAADTVACVLKEGEDACFLTLGDPLLYSTYIYLLRSIKKIIPDLQIVTVPGITAFSAAAALTDFPVGEGKEPVTIFPAINDLSFLKKALKQSGTFVLMKIGSRLKEILKLLEEECLIDDAVFISRAGHYAERVEVDLRKLKGENPEAGYLSIILLHNYFKKREV